jgi:hypothetical protein
MNFQLIGNERKDDQNLIAVAKNNRTIKNILNGKEIRTSYIDFPYTVHCSKTIKLVDNIEKSIQSFYFSEGGKLFQKSISANHEFDATSNALMAMCYMALEEHDIAESLLRGISLFGFQPENNLFYVDKDLGTFDPILPNTLIAIAYRGLDSEKDDYKNKAKELSLNIDAYVKGHMDEAEEVKNSPFNFENNKVVLALNNYFRGYSEEVNNFFKQIPYKTDKKTHLVFRNLGDDNIASKTLDNALIAVLYMASEKPTYVEKGIKIVDAIEKNILYHEKTGLFFDSNGEFSSIDTKSNAALAFAFSMRETYKQWLEFKKNGNKN